MRLLVLVVILYIVCAGSYAGVTKSQGQEQIDDASDAPPPPKKNIKKSKQGADCVASYQCGVEMYCRKVGGEYHGVCAPKGD